MDQKKVNPEQFAKAIGGERICGALAHPACGKAAQGKRCGLKPDHEGNHEYDWGDGSKSVWIRE